METYRCFLAVDLPDQLKKYLSGIQNQLKNWHAGVKWVETDNFHLTLKFLGDTPLNKIQEMSPFLEQIAARYSPWQISLDTLGAFPGARNPKVIWVGIKDTEQGLNRLWHDIEKDLEQIGFARERKLYSPHLTIGRVKNEIVAPSFTEVASKIDIEPISCRVSEFKLMRSILTRSGPEYSCINSFNLQEH